MTNKTEMVSVPRELLERCCILPRHDSVTVNSQEITARGRAQAELRVLLAAPAEAVRAPVDEPVAWMTRCIKGVRKGAIEEVAGPESVSNFEYWSPPFPVYARPQRPVVLPERMKIGMPPHFSELEVEGWNACLDEIERLNK